MKKLLLFTLVFPFSIFLSSALAQHAPQKFNYQAIARDAAGKALAEQEVLLRISILSGDAADRPVYVEEHAVVTNKLGLFNLQIGTGNAVEGSMQSIDWGSASHYINVAMDAEGTGRFEEMGTSQLLSVPYALYAEKSGSANAGDGRNDPNDWTINGNAATDDAINFIGTLDENDLAVRTNDTEVARFKTTGDLDLAADGRLTIDGQNALSFSGTENVLIGNEAGNSLTTGQRNMLIGWQSGYALTTGGSNTFLGYRTGYATTTGAGNAFIGSQAGQSNLGGSYNVFLGGNAGQNNTTGNNNLFLGLRAGQYSTTGLSNIAIGTNAGRNLSTSSDNAFIGREAGLNTTTGASNTFIGRSAGQTNTTGSSNTYIGYQADGSADLTNATAIGSGSSVTQSNSVVLGNNANVGIGTSAPSAKLHVEGSLKLVDGTQADGYVLTSDSTGNASWTAPYFNSLATNAITLLDGCASGDYTSLDANHSGTGLNVGLPEQWQSFTAEETGYLDSIALQLFSNRSSPLTILIYEGEGVTQLLGEIEVTDSLSQGWNTFDFSSLGIAIVAGEQYTFQLEEEETLKGTTGNKYSGGRHSFSSSYDVNFKIYIYHPCEEEIISLSSDSSGVLINGVDTLNFSDGSYLTSGTITSIVDADADTKIQVEESSDEDYIRFDVSGTEAMIISDAGNIGIGTGTPDTTLHVVGQIKYDDGNQADGYVLTSDASGNASWTSASSLAVITVFDTLNGVVIPGNAVDETSDDFVFGSTQLDDDGNSDHDSRFFFDKSKSAFRVGKVLDATWDSDSIGQYSFAAGYNADASSNYSVAMGYFTEAAGFGSTAFGYSTKATGSYSVAMGNNTEASGSYSIALGRETTASGGQSFATGWTTAASGTFSSAMGRSTVASGNYSFGTGYNATASGEFSVAMGTFVRAESENEVTIGAYNTDYTPNGTDTWDEEDRLFVIGNGTSSSTRSDAMVVLKSGEIGIGTSTPDTTLHVVGQIKYDDGNQADGYVLASDADGNASWTAASSLAVTTVFDTLGGVVIPGSAVDETSDDFVFGSDQLDDDGNTNHDSRFFFDKSKGAFRAGSVTNDLWDEDSLGINSIASGYNALASGDYSTAFGRETEAIGNYAFAVGNGAVASGVGSMSLGNFSTANGYMSTAMGLGASSSANHSFALGYYSTASATSAAAIGSNATASGSRSAAIGANTTSYSGYEITVGRYNTSYTPISTTDWDDADRLFTIGNGTGSSNRSDALVVLKNGYVGIGNSSPSNHLDIETSDVLVTSRVYNDNGAGTARSYVGANGGGHINLIANASGADVYGIPDNYPGIATQYKDMVFATGNSGNNSTEKMRLTTDGNLGIGTTDPFYLLQVGDAGDGTVARGNAWNTFSDRRWKKDFEVIPNALGKLQQVNGYFYNWKEGVDSTQQVGVVAQEIEEILPQAVSTDENGYKSVDYSKLTAWLIQVNKEQEDKMAAQLQMIEDLKTQLSAEKTNNAARLQRLEELMGIEAKAQR